MNLKEKKISILILIFIILILFFILSPVLKYSFIMADDVLINLPINGNIFKNPLNGNFLASFLDRIFCILLPLFFKIHPSDFKSDYFCYIEQLFILSFIFILNNLLVKKINYLYTVCFVFTTLLIFKFIQPVSILWLFVYDGFFRMFLPAFLFAGLFCLLLKNKNFNSNIVVTLTYLLTFLCCISNEMICISIMLGFLLYFILSVFSVKYNPPLLFDTRCFEFSLCKDKSRLFLFFILLISFLGGFIMYKAGAFIRKTDDNVILNIQYFINICKLIPEYIHYYVKYLFINHIIGYILLIFQMIILCVKCRKDENVIKTIKLILCFLCSIFVFFFLLIGLGKTHYIQGAFWVVHEDLHVIFNIILCIFNYALLSFIIEYKIIKKHILGIILAVLSLFLTVNNYIFYKYKNPEDIKLARQETYKAEKIIRLANLKGKTAMLNQDILSYWYLWNFYHTRNDYYNDLEQKENVFSENSEYIDFLNVFEKENKIICGFIITDSETSDKEFAANGGVFTEEELKHIKFNRLRDKDFLLNN